jgi:hypothetical protein
VVEFELGFEHLLAPVLEIRIDLHTNIELWVGLVRTVAVE